MKLFSKIFLFCFFGVLSWDILDGNDLKDSVILDGNIHDGLLSSDGSVQATEEDKDIKLSGYGRINLTLDYGELIFEVCPNWDCAEKSRVCFETTETRTQTKLQCSEVPSYCTFQVHKEGEKIFFGDAPVYKQDFQGSCLRPKIHSGTVKVVGIIKFDSCEPKIVDKILTLYVSISKECFITVKNAKVYVPPTASTSPIKVPPTNKSSPNDSAEATSFPDWGYIILAIAALIVIGAVVGCIAFYFYKKRQSSKRASQKPDGIKPKAIVSKTDIAADVKTPTKKNDDLEAAKIEPTQIPKKNQKKTKTVEPATTEDVPAPKKEKKSKTQEPTAAENVPAPTRKPKKDKKAKTVEPETTEDVLAPTVTQKEPPTLASKEPAAPERRPPASSKVKRLIPRGMKSAKTDSLDETLKKDKMAMVESLVGSTGKHCLKSDESDVLLKMKAAYPMKLQHDIMPSEVNILCLPVSKMFEEMDSMARDSQEKLVAFGCEFDERQCIVSVSDKARQFLKDKTTDATTVYFAFGAEFHKYISVKPGLMEEASIPLLYSIALQTRFSEKSRRKACAVLRRNLVKVLGYFKAADRAKMPFPVNIVENAYCKNPKYFYDPSEIKTDSASDEKKKHWP